MTDHDIAWAAGIFEGEGTIVLHKRKAPYRAFTCSLSVSMSDKDVIDKFLEVIGCGSLYYQAPKGPTYKPSWRWHIQDMPGVRKALNKLLPYLMSRRTSKANEMLKHINERVDSEDNYLRRGKRSPVEKRD